MSFGHYYKYFEKKPPKFNSKNTTPGEQKGEVIFYYIKAIEVEHL